MNTVKSFGRSFLSLVRRNQALASVAAFVGLALTSSGAVGGSFATTDPVAGGFTSLGTTLTTYIGEAIVLILLIFGLGLGIRLLIKYARMAIKAL